MFEIYAYGNVDTLTGVFNAIAAIMGGADYFGLIQTVAITGVLVAAFAGLFTPGRFAGWGWFIGFMLVYNAMFLPKVDVVVVDKLGSQPPVAAVAAVPYDLVLMDCEMPEMDGFEATTRIRAGEGGGRRLPIVALTAHDDPAVRSRCLSCGMDEFVSKPVREERLRDVLARRLG